MKNNTLKYLVAGTMFVKIAVCFVFKNNLLEYSLDSVCGMKAQTSEEHKCRCEEKKYYFDTYACK